MTPFNLSNAVLFQITWFACVIGGAADQALWGMVCAGIMLGLAQRTPYLRSDMALLGICLIAGFALDTLWIQSGVLDYPDAAVAPGVDPGVVDGCCTHHQSQSRLAAGAPATGRVACRQCSAVDLPCRGAARRGHCDRCAPGLA